MTIITALNDGQETWLGYNDGDILGDTPVASGRDGWLKSEDWVVGITGEAIQHDILELNLNKLSGAGSNPLMFVEKMRKVFVDYNHTADSNDDASPSFEITCILAHKNGNIWDVATCLSLTKIPKNTLWARGSGKRFAMGAANAVRDLSLPAEVQVTKATQAAIDCDIYCHGEAKVFKF